jgi:hypothetical protein
MDGSLALGDGFSEFQPDHNNATLSTAIIIITITIIIISVAIPVSS